MNKYDSKPDTINHIISVRKYLTDIIKALNVRYAYHDYTKLIEPEKSVFDRVTPNLKELTYGSDEYKAQLKEMQHALDHHYENNPHHPEHYENGIRGMNLVDLIEMICDWKAASERHSDGDIMKSIEINQKRFGYSDELKQILINTINHIIDPPITQSDISSCVTIKDYK